MAVSRLKIRNFRSESVGLVQKPSEDTVAFFGITEDDVLWKDLSRTRGSERCRDTFLVLGSTTAPFPNCHNSALVTADDDKLFNGFDNRQNSRNSNDEVQ